MTVTVALSNPAARPATLWVTAAGPGSGSDELVLGHGAAHNFLIQYWNRAGFLLQIPAHTTLPLLVHRLAPSGIASGLVQLALVEGDRLTLQVIARMEGDLDPPPDSYLPDADRVHQRGTFGPPDIMRPMDYTVGGPPLMMGLGSDQDLVHERITGEALQGNYGVVYVFPIRIDNPTAAPATLALVMHAVGGQAGGTFRIGDRVAEVPRVSAGGIQPIGTLRVAPGEHRTLVISTMPESGANSLVEPLSPHALGFRVTNTDREGRYRIVPRPQELINGVQEFNAGRTLRSTHTPLSGHPASVFTRRNGPIGRWVSAA